MLGTTLRGHYRIIKFLGTGGFGETYLAEDVDLPGCPSCVVKRLKPQSNDPFILQTAKRLFDNEAETLYRLGNHDQIPRLLAHFEENQEFYLVQEFIDGNVLSQELTPGTQWSQEQARLFLQDLLGILEFVHQQNVIHRDIKPANLIRRKRDGKLVLIDFGAVKEIKTLVNNAQGQINLTVSIGTPGYMPSEQSQGHPQFSSDVYAVGMVAIQALTGVPPKQLPIDSSLQVIWRDRVQVNHQVADILDKMVLYHFSQRYHSATEALQAIAALTTSSSPAVSLPPPPSPESSPPPPSPPTNWSPGQKITIFTSLFTGIVGVVAVVAIVMGRSPGQPLPPPPPRMPPITYENPKFGIKIKYPPNWDQREISNPITKEVVEFIAPGEGEPDRLPEKIIITVKDLSSPLSLEEYTDKSKQEIMQQNSNYKVLDEGDYTLAGNAAHRIVYTANDGNHKLITMEVWTLNNYQAYSIIYIASADKYDRFLPLAERMIKSLQIESKP